MLRMQSILDLPPLPRRKITIPLSTLAEVAREVCDGYDPPVRGRAYAKAHPLWRAVAAPPAPRPGDRPKPRPPPWWGDRPAPRPALISARVRVCRGRAGELTLTRCTSL